MSVRVSVSERIIENITVSVERLWITRAPRAACLLPLLIAELEPEAELVLAVEFGEELGLVEADRERLDRDAVHPARGVARNHRIRRDEAADAWVVIPRII